MKRQYEKLSSTLAPSLTLSHSIPFISENRSFVLVDLRPWPLKIITSDHSGRGRGLVETRDNDSFGVIPWKEMSEPLLVRLRKAPGDKEKVIDSLAGIAAIASVKAAAFVVNISPCRSYYLCS